MADNTRLNTNTTSGDLISTDDISDGGVANGSKVQRAKMGFGADGEYTDPSLATPFPVMPNHMVAAEIAAGNIAGYSPLLKFGQNGDVDIGPEDVWDGGGFYPWIDTAAQFVVLSTSGNDDVGNIGALTVKIFGLDASYNEVSETLVLEGTTPVTTFNLYKRIYRMYVVTAGSAGANLGDIEFRDSAVGTIRAVIKAGNNQTLMAIYTVPLGKTLFITEYFASIYNAATKGFGEIEVRICEFGSVFRLNLNAGLASDGTTSISHNFATPIKVTAKSDVLIRATTSVINTKAIAFFAGFLKDD